MLKRRMQAVVEDRSFAQTVGHTIGGRGVFGAIPVAFYGMPQKGSIASKTRLAHVNPRKCLMRSDIQPDEEGTLQLTCYMQIQTRARKVMREHTYSVDGHRASQSLALSNKPYVGGA